MTRTIVLAVIALVVFGPAARAALRVDRQVTVDGQERRYVAYLPDGYRQKGPLPVVLAFHGGLGNPDEFAESTNMPAAPEAQNFIIVYPAGYRRTWNEGGVCCGGASRDHVDDVKFVRTLLDDLEWLLPIDRRRVYATGYSNGGGMSYYLACAMSGEITAIAPVSAAMREPKPDCHPLRPVPVFDWHGLLDHISPYSGGPTTAMGYGPPPAVAETIAFWARVDGTQSVEHVSLFGGDAECDIYVGGRDGAKVEACRLPRMGHRWPGSHPTPKTEHGDAMIRMFVGDLGPYVPDVDADDAMLRFFREFALPSVPN